MNHRCAGPSECPVCASELLAEATRRSPLLRLLGGVDGPMAYPTALHSKKTQQAGHQAKAAESKGGDVDLGLAGEGGEP